MTNLILPLPAPLAAAGGDGLDYLEIARNSGPIGIGVLLLLLGASAVSLGDHREEVAARSGARRTSR